MGILLVYDVTDEASFQNIRNWMRHIEDHAADNVNKILLGNKCDLVDKKVVDTKRGEELAQEYGIDFLETSAKSNHNVEEAFYRIARQTKTRLIDSESQNVYDKNQNGPIKFPTSGPDPQQSSKKGCC
mmetsp:Transcript_2408/g.9064  ORF Transcript_2408/g.9064 Transcript_2408/m.9064 type:complete len:128 (-) Transcript_2408:816-1199(-)